MNKRDQAAHEQSYGLKESLPFQFVGCRDLGAFFPTLLVNRAGNRVTEKLMRIAKPLFYLPNLAIHLQTAEEIAAFKINKVNMLISSLVIFIKTQG